jgi:hypothetical protein
VLLTLAGRPCRGPGGRGKPGAMCCSNHSADVARDKPFLSNNGFRGKDYSAPTYGLRIWQLSLRFPNTKAHRWAYRFMTCITSLQGVEQTGSARRRLPHGNSEQIARHCMARVRVADGGGGLALIQLWRLHFLLPFDNFRVNCC